MKNDQNEQEAAKILRSTMSPESLMMSHGYDPQLSQGAVKPPIFQTSTFVFKTAEEGKHYFEIAYGLKEQGPNDEMGLIYSRLNNPGLEILEDRLCLWDDAESCSIFSSGMAAVSTVTSAHLEPGDAALLFEPAYGGTEYLFNHILPKQGINIIRAKAGAGPDELEALIEASGVKEKLRLVFLETPANPTNTLTDIGMVSKLASKYSRPDKKVLVAVDNTFLGPIWQKPLSLGADIVLYSATKYIGGHSDLIAGVCLGAEEVMKPIRDMRTFLGNMASPWTGWLLMRSLETLKIRMDAQTKNAQEVVKFLAEHPKVKTIHFLGNLKPGTEQYEIYLKQCSAPGAVISFDINGDEKEAFQFLNALKLFKLAVSLGGTESLAEHPSSMTHSDLTREEQTSMGIEKSMVRLAIGIENPKDLISDLEQAFRYVD